MLSRRNTRIKVMQTLYAMKQDETVDSEAAEKNYLDSVEEAYRLYLYNMLNIQKVIEYAEKAASIKSSKHLPNEGEEEETLLLINNPFSQVILDNQGLREKMEQEDLAKLLDSDITRKLYRAFTDGDDWTKYLALEERDEKSHRNLLLNLYKCIIKSEVFVEHLEDYFPAWLDDKSLVVGACKKTIKALSIDEDFVNTHAPDEETSHEFGANLLYETIRNDEALLEIIVPRLKNWEVDRVASLDLIMMKMSIAEMLYFPTIPTKVSINEYVDIARDYSTANSKDFINGVLDRALKELEAEDKIEKEGRGLSD